MGGLRAKTNKCQTDLLEDAWNDSGKVADTYWRKLHDDLCDQGETCCPNPVPHLARFAGIKSQIEYNRHCLARQCMFT